MGFLDRLLGREKDTTVEDFERATRLAANSAGSFRMTVEDVFTITGRGTVATGTIENGVVTKGETVTITGPSGQGTLTAEVTGVEAFRKVLESAGAGENVGLLLSGVTRDQLDRGSTITRA